MLDQPVTEAVDVGVAESQTTTSTDRFFVLRIISPLGKVSDASPLRESQLNDLPSLFKKLPDGHYQVYLSEGGHERLVINVIVRQGRPVDSSEDSGGAGDRPPTSQIDSDQANGLTDADSSAAKDTGATALEKLPANNSIQPATGGNNKSTPPAGPTPGATQTPPPIPAAAHGTPTAATNRDRTGSLWSKRVGRFGCGRRGHRGRRRRESAADRRGHGNIEQAIALQKRSAFALAAKIGECRIGTQFSHPTSDFLPCPLALIATLICRNRR